MNGVGGGERVISTSPILQEFLDSRILVKKQRNFRTTGTVSPPSRGYHEAAGNRPNFRATATATATTGRRGGATTEENEITAPLQPSQFEGRACALARKIDNAEGRSSWRDPREQVIEGEGRREREGRGKGERECGFSRLSVFRGPRGAESRRRACGRVPLRGASVASGKCAKRQANR